MLCSYLRLKISVMLIMIWFIPNLQMCMDALCKQHIEMEYELEIMRCHCHFIDHGCTYVFCKSAKAA